MRRDPKTGAPDFFTFARDYLHTYLPTIRGALAENDRGIPDQPGMLPRLPGRATNTSNAPRSSFDHFDREHLKAWMAWLADDKHYAPRTITLRLSAIKAFLAYAAAEDVTLVALSQAARTLKAARRTEKTDRVPHRGRDPGRPRRFHRAHGEITPEPDAAHPALRHRRPRR